MSNSLDPDQDGHFVGPDLSPNCLQRLSADDTGGVRVKESCVLSGALTILFPRNASFTSDSRGGTL